MLLSVSISKQSRKNTGMLFEIRFVNAPLTWNNFLSRARDFYNPSCNLHVEQLFSSRWRNIYMREAIGAEVSAPPAFGTLAPLNKSPYSRPFISHVPFNTVPSKPSIRRSIWTVVHWLFWLSIRRLWVFTFVNHVVYTRHAKRCWMMWPFQVDTNTTVEYSCQIATIKLLFKISRSSVRE